MKAHTTQILAALCGLALASACTASPHPEPGQAASSSARVTSSAASDPAWEAISDLRVRAEQTGLASWYGPGFHGRLTASGETFDQHALTAAHRHLPLRSLARVTNLETGDSVLVRINDRGPFIDGRIIDLSQAAAAELGFIDEGLAPVRVEALGPADPDDRAARSRIITGR